jgi:glycopeptide antibiotics resistance protein
MLFSVAKHKKQKVTRYRTTEKDQVFLNTTGAAFGYITYLVISNYFKSSKPLQKEEMEISYNPTLN